MRGMLFSLDSCFQVCRNLRICAEMRKAPRDIPLTVAQLERQPLVIKREWDCQYGCKMQSSSHQEAEGVIFFQISFFFFVQRIQRALWLKLGGPEELDSGRARAGLREGWGVKLACCATARRVNFQPKWASASKSLICAFSPIQHRDNPLQNWSGSKEIRLKKSSAQGITT